MHIGTSFLGLTYDPKILNHGKCSKISNISLSVLKKINVGLVFTKCLSE